MREYINELTEKCRELGAYTDFNETEVKLHFCKQYLQDTDYAIIKMYETVVQGGSIIQMLAEYKEVLSKRKEARQLINELEKEQ